MPPPVLVTGATGTVGRCVLAALARSGVRARAAARRPAPASRLVEPVSFDFQDPTTFAAAFAGVETALVVRPPALSRVRDLAPALRAASAAGLQHVVFLSVQGAEKFGFLPHAGIERWLRASTMTWTFLRPSFFDQNLVAFHAAEIREHDELTVPAGRGRTAFVDAADVAEVAALVLAHPSEHAGRAYTLTGSQALTYTQVAAIMSRECGRPIRYTQPSLLRYASHARTDLGLPPALVLATSVVYTTARLGLAGRTTSDTADLLGRPATTVEQFVRREHHQFMPAPEV